MNKRIAVWGDLIYRGISYDECGNRIKLSKSCVMNLSVNNEVVNYSMKGLSIIKTFDYITKALKYDSNFDYIILEVGYYDLIECIKGSSDINTFKSYLINIIEIINEYKIPVLINNIFIFDFLEFKSKNYLDLNIDSIKTLLKQYNEAISKIAESKNCLIISHETLIGIKNKNITDDRITLNTTGHGFLTNLISGLI